MTRTRTYPHVAQIGDFPTQQTVRLLWERVMAMEETLTAQASTIQQQAGTIQTLQTQVTRTARDAREALITAGQAVGVEGVSGGGGGGGGCPDDGLFAAGVAAAPATGHPAGGLPLDAQTAGKIVGGTGQEFSSLLAATVNLAARESNADALIRRMIWHLNQYGFVAGRQQNPSGLISKDKVAVTIGGTAFAYDVLSSLNAYTVPMTVTGGRVCPANLQSDAGLPD